MTDSDPQATSFEDEAALRKKAKHEARIDFWFSSIARGTLLVYSVSFVTLSIWLTHSNIQADGFTVGALIQGVIASALWSFIVLVGSCYASIPIATLLVAALRGIIRRRRRGREPARTLP